MKKNAILILTIIYFAIIANNIFCQPIKRIWSKGTNFTNLDNSVNFSFSPDSKYLSTCSQDGSVKIWNAETGEYIYKIWQDKSELDQIVWSPDNERIAFGGFEYYFKMYNFINDSLEFFSSKLDSLAGFHINKIKFSEVGNFLTCYGTPNFKLVTISLGDKLKENSIYGSHGIRDYLLFSDDEKYFTCYLAVYPYDKDISNDLIIYSLNKLDTMTILKNLDPLKIVNGFTSNYFYLFDNSSIRFYDLNDFHFLSYHQLKNIGCYITKDGKYALTLDTSNYISLWNLKDFNIIYRIKVLKPESKYLKLEISPDNKYFSVSGTYNDTNYYNIGTYLECYDLLTGAKLWNSQNDINASQCVTISPDNKYVIASNDEGGLTLLKRENGDLIKILSPRKCSADITLNSDFSSDLIHFAFSYYSNGNKSEENVLIYNINELNNVDTLMLGKGGASCLKYSPNGKYLAIGLREMQTYWNETFFLLQFFDLQSKNLKIETKLSDRPTSLSFSKDGKNIAVGTASSNLYVFKVDNDSIKRKVLINQKGKKINNVVLSKDGNIVVAANSDGILNSWNVDKNELIQSYNDQSVNVTSVKLSSDGKTIISAGFDGKIKFWDFASGKLKYSSVKKETGMMINDLKLSEDEKYLIIGDAYNDGIMMYGLDLVSEIHENNIKENSIFEISPNPATDYIVIQPSEGLETLEGSDILIFNTLGEIIMSVEQTSSSVQNIDISKLIPGMYFIKIGNRVEKFVKI